jgi:hypothetical protein
MALQGLTTTNPMGIAALGHPTWKAVSRGVAVIAVIALGAAALAPLLRFRRADLVQRQQLKWFAFVIGICAPSALVGSALTGVLPVVATVLSYLAIAGLVVGLPAAVGLAILRYRLYDIDRLINRAVVYATLTAVLGLGYAAAVLALGQLFGGVGEHTPSLAVAGATLAVAALFQPARRRIQQAVDRRFNRRKYNTAKTIDAFSTACATRSTSTRSPPSCWRSSTRPWSRPKPRCGFDLPHPAPRAQLPVRHGRLPGPTEHHRRPLPQGCSSVKTSRRRPTSSLGSMARQATNASMRGVRDAGCVRWVETGPLEGSHAFQEVQSHLVPPVGRTPRVSRVQNAGVVPSHW